MVRSLPRCVIALGCASSLLTTGCPKPGQAAASVAEAPDMAQETGQAKCGVRKSASKPLVVEWPAADRAALEARAARGLIAVRYEGCEMEVLTNCTAAGAYSYLGLTQKRESVRIRNADELYANLPVGAAKLEGKLERAGQLNVDMVIVGRKESDRHTFNERDLDGRCDEATHVVTGLTVGAFSFYTGKSADIGAGASVGNIGAGAGSSHEQEVLKQDGDEASCALTEPGSMTPPSGCGALLRVEVVPVDRIFGTTHASNTTSTTSGSTTSSTNSNTGGPTDTGPPPDPALDKKIRVWRGLLITGYSVALASLGGLYGGIFLRKKAETDLAATLEDPSGDAREKAIRKGEAGTGLLWGSVAALVAFGTLGFVAQARLVKLKRQRSAWIGPTWTKNGAGLAAGFKF